MVVLLLAVLVRLWEGLVEGNGGARLVTHSVMPEASWQDRMRGGLGVFPSHDDLCLSMEYIRKYRVEGRRWPG